MTTKIEFRVGSTLKEAWGIFLKGPEVFISVTFGAMALFFVMAYLPFIGQFVVVLLSALTPAAIYIAAEDGAGKESVSFDSVKQLLPVAPQLVMLFLVKTILIGIGFFLLLLPGIYLAVIFAFAEFFVLFRGKNFWDALLESKKLVEGNFLVVFGLVVFLSLLAFSGIMLVGIGILVTAPIAMITLNCEFRRIGLRAGV